MEGIRYYLSEDGTLFCHSPMGKNLKWERFGLGRSSPCFAPDASTQFIEEFKDWDEAMEGYTNMLTGGKKDQYRWVVFVDNHMSLNALGRFLEEVGAGARPLMAQLVSLPRPIYFGMGEALISIDEDGESWGRGYLLP